MKLKKVKYCKDDTPPEEREYHDGRGMIGTLKQWRTLYPYDKIEIEEKEKTK